MLATCIVTFVSIGIFSLRVGVKMACLSLLAQSACCRKLLFDFIKTLLFDTASPLAGFLAFLRTLAQHPWKERPLVVDPDGAMDIVTCQSAAALFLRVLPPPPGPFSSTHQKRDTRLI